MHGHIFYVIIYIYICFYVKKFNEFCIDFLKYLFFYTEYILFVYTLIFITWQNPHNFDDMQDSSKYM